jgi:hypothetical protein
MFLEIVVYDCQEDECKQLGEVNKRNDVDFGSHAKVIKWQEQSTKFLRGNYHGPHRVISSDIL